MIIKKYKAKTEQEAILMAREELGPDAIVMNVKTIKLGGFMRLFKKSRVELTAAIDDHMAEKAGESQSREGGNESGTERESYRFGKAFSDTKPEYSEDAKNAIEEKINSIAKLLEQQMQTAKQEKTAAPAAQDSHGFLSGSERDPYRDIPADRAGDRAAEHRQGKSKVVELIYQQLLDNGVDKKYADVIIGELDSANDRQPIDNALASVYQKIVLKLGEIEPIKPDENKPKIIFFVGNTGVGKTTTMAKLASKCKLEDKLSVALFSVDTYRIAAIEQIKTYANILNAPMEVVYTPEDMKKNVEKYKEYDLILVDTAGRSHRNEEQREDLKAILDSVPDYDKEIYLVMSMVTKYSDLHDIVDTYNKLFDYRMIFTKLDETKDLGSILNLKLDVGKQLSYVTWGQNVPDDIGLLNPQIIAKKLLGGAG